MTVLSLDLNTRFSGVIVWRQGQPVDRFTLRAANLDGMVTALRDTLDSFQPRAVGTEKPYLGANPHSYGVLCELVGVLRGWCDGRAALYVLSTSQIDAAAGIRAAAGERKAHTAALARLELAGVGVGKLDEHQCDSYAIGVAVLGLIKTGEWSVA